MGNWLILPFLLLLCFLTGNVLQYITKEEKEKSKLPLILVIVLTVLVLVFVSVTIYNNSKSSNASDNIKISDKE